MTTTTAAVRRADRDALLETAPAPSRRRVVLVLGALIALGPATIDMYLPALPTLGDDLSATPAQVQLTLTGTLVGLGALGLIVLAFHTGIDLVTADLPRDTFAARWLSEVGLTRS